MIGYGNTLRGDDAVGVAVINILEARRAAQTTLLSYHQLIPELTPVLAEASFAVFVDAFPSEVGGRTQVRRIHLREAQRLSAHVSSPESLLSAARMAYGRRPVACVVAVPGVDFAFGETLSPTATRGVAQAVVAVRRLLRRHRGRRRSRCMRSV